MNRYRKIRTAWRRLWAELRLDEVGVYSAQAAFYTLGSLIPLFALALGVAGILFPSVILSAAEGAEGVLPRELWESIHRLAARTFTRRSLLTLISVGAAVTLWSAARGMRVLFRATERLSGAADSSYANAVFRGVCATLLLIVSLGGLLFLRRFRGKIPFFLASAPILWVLCICLYRIFLPNRTSRTLWRAGLCSVGWEGLSLAFSLYLKWAPEASRLYGSLGAVFFGMIVIRAYLWLFLFFALPVTGSDCERGERHRAAPAWPRRYRKGAGEGRRSRSPWPPWRS